MFREMSMLFWYNLLTLDNTDGLYCTYFDGDTFRCSGNDYTFGAAADSMYEYMLKQWVMTNGADEVSIAGWGLASGPLSRSVFDA